MPEIVVTELRNLGISGRGFLRIGWPNFPPRAEDGMLLEGQGCFDLVITAHFRVDLEPLSANQDVWVDKRRRLETHRPATVRGQLFEEGALLGSVRWSLD